MTPSLPLSLSAYNSLPRAFSQIPPSPVAQILFRTGREKGSSFFMGEVCLFETFQRRRQLQRVLSSLLLLPLSRREKAEVLKILFPPPGNPPRGPAVRGGGERDKTTRNLVHSEAIVRPSRKRVSLTDFTAFAPRS